MKNRRLSKAISAGLLTAFLATSVSAPFASADDEVVLDKLEQNVTPIDFIQAASYSATVTAEDLNWGYREVTPMGRAFNMGYTGKGVKVAILDTGIAPNAEFDVKGGISFVAGTDSSDYVDRHGHGTLVAGVIAAKRDGKGVAGVAPLVDIYAVKVLGDNAEGSVSWIAQGVDWAIANKMDIINMSIGYLGHNTQVAEALLRAEEAGVTVVLAAGNNKPAPKGGSSVSHFAKSDTVIAVSALNETKTIASFSSTGSEVDFTAPGEKILGVSIKDFKYAYSKGTSVASPHIAGLAALIKQEYPDYTPTQVREALQRLSVDLGDAGVDEQFGYGMPTFSPKDILVSASREDIKVLDSKKIKTILGDLPKHVGMEYGAEAHNMFDRANALIQPKEASLAKVLNYYNSAIGFFKGKKDYEVVVVKTADCAVNLVKNSLPDDLLVEFVLSNVSSKKNVKLVVDELKKERLYSGQFDDYLNTP